MDVEPDRVAFDELLSRLASDGAVIVGPWLSEVGFEVLYWIPFLQGLVEEHGLDPARSTAVSRGGVRDWYAGICDSYAETFDAVSVEEFKLGLERRWATTGGQKHVAFDSWDRELLARTVGEATTSATILHPSQMYRRMREGWRGNATLSAILDQLRFPLWTLPRDAEVESRLPPRFVAVKFYSRPSFPDTPEHRSFVRRFVAALSEDIPVVLLASRHEYDDHADFDAGGAHEVIRLLDGIPSATNLRAQSIAIGRADAFLGTYGGLAYLASAYGVPAIGFVSHPTEYVPVHLDVGRHAAEERGTSLTVVDLRTAPLLRVATRLLERVARAS